MNIRLDCPYADCPAARPSGEVISPFVQNNGIVIDARDATIVDHGDGTGLLLFCCPWCSNIGYRYLTRALLVTLKEQVGESVRQAPRQDISDPQPVREVATAYRAGRTAVGSFSISVSLSRRASRA